MSFFLVMRTSTVKPSTPLITPTEHGRSEAASDYAELIREARGQPAGDRFDVGGGYDEDFLVFRGTEDRPMDHRPGRFQVADVQVQIRDRAMWPALGPMSVRTGPAALAQGVAGE